MRDLVPLVQFKKHEKHLWRTVTFTKVKVIKVALVHECFSHFYKFDKWYQIMQSITYYQNIGCLWIKDNNQRQKPPSNKTPALTKTMNMDICVVGHQINSLHEALILTKNFQKIK